jgi:hypothetical protein
VSDGWAWVWNATGEMLGAFKALEIEPSLVHDVFATLVAILYLYKVRSPSGTDRWSLMMYTE